MMEMLKRVFTNFVCISVDRAGQGIIYSFRISEMHAQREIFYNLFLGVNMLLAQIFNGDVCPHRTPHLEIHSRLHGN